jgi:hypothetical protein
LASLAPNPARGARSCYCLLLLALAIKGFQVVLLLVSEEAACMQMRTYTLRCNRI